MIDSDDLTASTVDLAREALAEARELIKLEMALARNDLESELARARTAAIAFAIAVLASSAGLAMLLVAVALASGAPVAVAGGGAIILFAAAAAAAALGHQKVAATFLRQTRERIGTDIRELEERAHGA